MRWLTVPLKKVAPASPANWAFGKDEPVWNLNLEQIESHTGRILNKLYQTPENAGNSTFAFDAQCVLYSKLRPYLNKVVVPDEAGIATTELIPLRPIQGMLDRNFLGYFLRSNEFLSFASATVAGAKMPRMDMKMFWNYEIPLPPLAEQERIVRVLDEAEELRRLRAQADLRTKDLIPALFYDMFGSPAYNKKGWPMKLVVNLYDETRSGAKCGPFGSMLKVHEYTEQGIPVWGIPNVSPNQFIEEGSLFITSEKFNQLRAYEVRNGDILISRAGTVGRVCVATPSAPKSIIGTNLIRIGLNQNQILPVFFSSLMTHFPKEVGCIRADGDEGAYSFVNTTTLKTLRIILPPLPLQREFAARVAEIRELEAQQAASRRKLDELFQSFLHRAFRGELFDTDQPIEVPPP